MTIECKQKKTPYMEFFILEKEMKLFTLEYKNVKYWQLVRFGLLKKITTKDLRVVNSNAGRSKRKEVIGAYKASHVAQKMLHNVSHADIIRIRPCVTVNNEGKLADHQYDYVDFAGEEKILDLYALGNYTMHQDCVEYDMSPAEKTLINWKILKKLYTGKQLEKRQIAVLSEFLKQVNKIYGTEFEIGALIHNIYYLVNSHIIYKAYYAEVFRQLTPKIVMEYPHYDEHMFSATAAARQLGIATVEIQHGRINSHEAYWYEDQEKMGKLLPDYFFVYGDWWKQQINLPEFCKVVAIGNPYLEAQIKMFPKKQHWGKVLAVFSNPQNGKVLSEFIYELEDYFKTNGIKILYKLHPNERAVWKTEYPCLAKLSNATVIDDSTSVYEVLSDADVAIGINSTVFFEALAYKNIKLLIYAVGDYEGMKPLINSGAAKALTTTEELKKEIEILESTSEENINGAQFWKECAAENLKKEISYIIKRS